MTSAQMRWRNNLEQGANILMGATQNKQTKKQIDDLQDRCYKKVWEMSPDLKLRERGQNKQTDKRSE